MQSRKTPQILLGIGLLWVAITLLTSNASAQATTVASGSNSVAMTPVQHSEASMPPKPSPTYSLPSDALGPNDLLELNVSYCPELSRNFRVAADGSLKLPLLHDSIPVDSLTPEETAKAIKEALVRSQILADPTVIVSVVEYRSRPVSVTGAVAHPLTFQATGQVTLLDAIAMAGGVTPVVGSDIIVTSTHHVAAGKIDVSVQRIPVQGLLAQSNPAYNLSLHGGEDIRITEAGKVFIAGNVNKPGMYPMQGTGETTVIKALALSQGLQAYYGHTAYIYRAEHDGTRKEIPIALSRIINRKDPDVDLLADDVLYVPDASGKRNLIRVVNGLAGFGQATAAGLLIYR